MKLLLSVAVLAVMFVTAKAECTISGLSIFPAADHIYQNPVFVLEGYEASQQVVTGLNTRYRIYLESPSEKIPLIVTETHAGQYHLTQALLRPAHQLKAGDTYTLCIDSLPRSERVQKVNDISYRRGPVTYTVMAGRDTKKPVVPVSPEELNKTLVHYACGPSIYVSFSNPAQDQSELLVKTTVKNIQTGKETTYLIIPRKNQLQVGHGMCAGAFDFDEQLSYEVRFVFMDASGNIAKRKSDAILFSKPVKETPDDEVSL